MKMFWVRDEEVGVAVIADSREEALAKGAEELDYASAEEVEEGGLEALDEDEMEDEPTGSLTYWREIVEREVRRARAEERESCAARIKQAADQLDAAAARIGELVAERDMAKTMIDDLNDDLIRVLQERNAASAEEREACAQIAVGFAVLYDATLVSIDDDAEPGHRCEERRVAVVGRRDTARDITDAIRARSKGGA